MAEALRFRSEQVEPVSLDGVNWAFAPGAAVLRVRWVRFRPRNLSNWLCFPLASLSFRNDYAYNPGEHPAPRGNSIE